MQSKLLFLLMCCILGLILHISIGSYLWFSPIQTLKELLSGHRHSSLHEDLSNHIIWSIRLPRALGCVLGGALLGSVGAVFQTLFRNPLADPYILGVSSGAAIGGTLALVWGLNQLFGGLGIMSSAIITGMSSLLFVIFLSRSAGVINIPNLLLSGVVMGSLQSSIVTLILMASGRDSNQILSWLLGNTTPMFWDRIIVMFLVLVIGGAILFSKTRLLNAFAAGEASAQRLGVNTTNLKKIVLFIGTTMTAVSVGSMGVLGFIGLVAPHIARLVVGVDLRYSFLASLMTGSFLTLFADLIAQRAIPHVELPIGVVTALLGAPVLIFLLKKKESTYR